ncbi:MAG TPA: flagellar hook-basal body complex protein FliE [Bryobacteraceae bacterium]|nr:flagellar hook-basal body complex protein FliE [Bryobacteraceae bacterium]
MNISLLTNPIEPLEPATAAASSLSGNFANVMAAAIGNVEGTQATADRMASDLLINGRGDVHSVALASQQAELSMEMFQQVRNKFVQAYQEVMKMPM